VTGGTTKYANGYSWLEKLLPYTEYTTIYKNLPQAVPASATGVYGLIASNGSVAVADQTKIPDFICPSNNNNPFINFSASPPTGSCTNYKAMAASTEPSLLCALGTGTAPYGSISLHPDGAIYPSANGTPLAALQSDGLSHTITIMETQDASYSRWICGTEAQLVGLPTVSGPTGTTPGTAYPYFYPAGYDGTFGDSSGVAQGGKLTYLEYDFSATGGNIGSYLDPGWDTTYSGMKGTMYGPSSGHPAIAVVGFADGNAQGLNKRCDAANMFFLITRNNGDPFNIP
jgi:hypothetical protein